MRAARAGAGAGAGAGGEGAGGGSGEDEGGGKIEEDRGRIEGGRSIEGESS